MITKEQIQARIETLTVERGQAQERANQLRMAHDVAIQNISAYNGAIQALGQLLEETPVQPTNGAVDEELMEVVEE